MKKIVIALGGNALGSTPDEIHDGLGGLPHQLQLLRRGADRKSVV